MMEKRRFFVGSLPHEIDEDVIKNRFSKYGDVLSVELKHRYGGINESDILSTFAFVDLQGSEEAISTCLKKLSRKKWLGKEVTIQFAKESILSRLENERKLNMKNNLKEKTVNDGAIKVSPYVGRTETIDSPETRKSVNVSSSNMKGNSLLNKNTNESVSASSDTLTKMEMFSDVWKDCDEFSGRKVTKFDDSDFAVVPNDTFRNHRRQDGMSRSDSNVSVNIDYSDIPKKSFTSRQLALSSEEKRLKSVEEMKKAIDQRKLFVKKALSSVDSGNLNKKIVFNDDEDDEDSGNYSSKKVTSGNQLFDDDSGDEEEAVQSFSIKQQFEGDKGKKLFQLQSKFGNDSRFFMDERFYENEEEKIMGNDDQEESKDFQGDNIGEEENVGDEVQKQLEILQSIVGDKDVARQRKKMKLDKPAITTPGVRYDPSIPEHEKFIMKPSDESNTESVSKKSKKKLRGKEKTEEDEQQNLQSVDNNSASLVSKETFYEVTDELKQTFKSAQKSSFSFSEMFQSSSSLVGNNEKRELTTSGSSSFSSKNNSTSYNNFNDDRFGGDFSSEIEKSESSDKTKNKQPEKRPGSLWHENFFYRSDDPRLEEANKFFSRGNVEDFENFEGKRKELKKIIKKKVMNKTRSERPFKKKIGTSGRRKNFKKRRLH